jgi:hypothetical protein
MPLKPKISVAGLIRCGKCGKRYSNPITHVCVTSRKRHGRTRIRPKAAVSIGHCSKCGKEWVNPLTHSCTGGGDFARRAAAEKKAVAARKRAASKHEYAECGDQDCTSYACRVYREGREDGYQDGYSDGYAEGAAAASQEGE